MSIRSMRWYSNPIAVQQKPYEINLRSNKPFLSERGTRMLLFPREKSDQPREINALTIAVNQIFLKIYSSQTCIYAEGEN